MSENLGAWFRRHASDRQSDIAPHFGRFQQLIADHDVRTIVELGSRAGASTSAWLYFVASRGQVWAVDIDYQLAPRARLNPVVGDDLDPAVAAQVPDTIDLLFIDTSHAYDHTCAELALYGPRVRAGGVIVLHDTANEHPEDTEPSISAQDPFPVRRAMVEYADAHGLRWDENPDSWGLGVIYC